MILTDEQVLALSAYFDGIEVPASLMSIKEALPSSAPVVAEEAPVVAE